MKIEVSPKEVLEIITEYMNNKLNLLSNEELKIYPDGVPLQPMVFEIKLVVT
jgi:hypothetical protein